MEVTGQPKVENLASGLKKKVKSVIQLGIDVSERCAKAKNSHPLPKFKWNGSEWTCEVTGVILRWNFDRWTAMKYDFLGWLNWNGVGWSGTTFHNGATLHWDGSRWTGSKYDGGIFNYFNGVTWDKPLRQFQI